MVLVGAGAIGVVLLSALVLAGVSGATGGGLCMSRTSVSLAVEPSLEGRARDLVDRASDDSCHSYSVTAVSSSEMAGRLARREALPDLWIPDSAVRLARISQDVQLPFDTVLNSVASTPVVLASKGTTPDASTWTAALAGRGVRMGDPTRSGTADAPIMAATSEVEQGRAAKEALGTSMAALAQGQSGRQGPAPTEEELVRSVADQGGTAIVSERAGVSALRGKPDSGLVLTAPQTGAVYLNYPLAVVTQDAGRREDAGEAASALRDAATTSSFSDGLAGDGFRRADRAPLADGAGVGEVDALVVRDPVRLDTALQRWRLLAMPSRALVLLDTSGSMSTQVDGTDKTRIQLLTETAAAGLGQFPDDAALGLWAFGGDAGRNGHPYQELAPVRGLGASEGPGTHRQALGAGLQKLPSLVGGGTDLYQSVLDAYRSAQTGYDPSMVNSIIVISDGANDTVSPLSHDDFLSRLRAMVDPARPVVVVTIGILEDADPGTLAEIARVTGGNSHLARTPAEMPQVFAQAIQQRGQG